MISRVNNKIKGLTKRLRFHLNKPYSEILKRDEGFIIMYHGVTSISENKFNGRHTFIDDFEKQIQYLSKNTNLVSLKDFFNSKDKSFKIAITFDDGFKNNFTYAAPILKRYNVPASMFITGLVNEDHPFIWADFLQICSHSTTKNILLGDELYIVEDNIYIRQNDRKKLIEIIKYDKPEYSFKLEMYSVLKDVFETVKNDNLQFWELMSDEDIVKLDKEYPNITIGSHGFLHNNLGNITLENAKKEVIRSKKYLEQLISKEIEEIAFPDGSYNEELYQFCIENRLNYQLAAGGSLHNIHRESEYIKDRFGIYQFGHWSSQIIF